MKTQHFLGISKHFFQKRNKFEYTNIFQNYEQNFEKEEQIMVTPIFLNLQTIFAKPEHDF